MLMIETELGFFDVKVEKSGFSITPERFNFIDMVGASGKLILAVMDSKMSFATNIDENQSNSRQIQQHL